MSKDANYCTIELSTGRMWEIEMTPESARAKIWPDGGNRVNAIKLPRLTSEGRADHRYRKHMWVRPISVVAIYPLDEGTR